MPAKGPASGCGGRATYCVDCWAAIEVEPAGLDEFLVSAGAVFGGVDEVGIFVEEYRVGAWTGLWFYRGLLL